MSLSSSRSSRKAHRPTVAAAVLSVAGIAVSGMLTVSPTAVAQSSAGNPALQPAISPMDVPYGSSKHLPKIGGNKLAGVPRKAHMVSKKKLQVANTGSRNDVWEVKVYSAANGQVVTNRIISPKGTKPRPSLILLPGSRGKASQRNWENTADLPGFFADKNVNVVSTLSGGYSFYSDWKRDDPNIEGRSSWETYIAKELPQVLRDEFHANDKMALGGVSMSATAALNIAAKHTRTFDAVASYSGFPVTTSPLGRALAIGVFLSGKANPANAWGYLDNPAWKRNDPARNVHKFKNAGTKVFVSSAGGRPGKIDESYGWKAWTDPMLGEFASDALTTEYAQRARKAGVDIYRYRRPVGSHTFPVFEDALHKSWAPVLKPALGL